MTWDELQATATVSIEPGGERAGIHADAWLVVRDTEADKVRAMVPLTTESCAELRADATTRDLVAGAITHALADAALHGGGGG